MTYDKLIQRALVPFEGRLGQLDSRAGFYMDEAQEDFALHTKCYKKKVNIYISANKVFVALPKDFLGLCDEPFFRGYTLKKSRYGGQEYNREVTTNQVNTGRPEEYAIENNKFYLLPRPSVAGILTISYIAIPASLRSKTGLKQMKFDNVVSEYFDVGDVIKSRVGASNTTNSQGTIERVDYDTPTGGVMTISNVTNGFLTDNENFFVSGPETAHYEAQYGTNWNSFQTTWNDLGFGGMASVQGPQYDFVDTSPLIPEPYHYHLVDYVKAMIHQDLGNEKGFNTHMSMYTGNKERARTTVAYADTGGMSYVSDEMTYHVI